MSNSKVTYKSVLEKVIAGTPLSTAEVDKVKALVAQLEKKSGADRKPTATQVANQGLMAAIKPVLDKEPNRLFTVSEVIKAVPAVSGMSNQKVSALMRSMAENGMAEQVKDKRKTLYRAVSAA